jgi:hypothetical protein
MQMQAPKTTLETTVNELLLQLGRPGARLRIAPGGLLFERPASKTRAAVAADVIAAATSAGYLTAKTQAGQTTSIVLSEAGRDYLRQLLMSGTTRDRSAGPKGARGRLATLHVASGREPARRSVVEQLAQRRDPRGAPLLEPVHVAAALRFAADFQASGLQPRVTARWSADAIPERRRRGAPGAGIEVAAAVSAAQERVRTALAALGGTLADLVLDVCGFDRGLEALEAEREWPKRAGRIMLKGALEQLAHHYGMFMRPPAGSAGVRQWGDGFHQPAGRAGRSSRSTD